MSNLNLFAYSSEQTAQQQTVTSVTAGNPLVIPPVSIDESPYQYRSIPQYAFTLTPDTAVAQNTAVELALTNIKAGSDDIDSFVIVPAGTSAVPATENLNALTNTSYLGVSGIYGTSANGFYPAHLGGAAVNSFFDQTKFSSLANICDKNYSTALTFRIVPDPANIGAQSAYAFKFKMPTINTSAENTFDFDAIYMGIRAKATSVCSSLVNLHFYVKRPFVNAVHAVIMPATTTGYLDLGIPTGQSVPSNLIDDADPTKGYLCLDTITRQYYNPLLENNDYNFRTKVYNDGSGSAVLPYGVITGFQSLPLISITPENYTCYSTGYIIIQLAPYPFAQPGGYPTDDFLYHYDTDIVYQSATPTQLTVSYPANWSVGQEVYAFGPVGSGTVCTAKNMITAISGRVVTLRDSLAGYGFANLSTISLSAVFIDFSLYELCLIFHKTISVKSEVYAANFGGRTFGGPAGTFDPVGTETSVWADTAHPLGRRASAAMIADPIDAMEHFLRLQNWGEVSGNNNIAGKTYSPNAKINTVAFDACGNSSSSDGYSTMAAIRDCRPSVQLTDKGDIKKTVQEFCRTFFVIRCQDNTGAETVVDCSSVSDTAQTIIWGTPGSGDINGKPGQIIEPDPRYIYCEPVVNFGYDYGAGQYARALGVTDATVSHSVFKDNPQAYTTGFQAADMAIGSWGAPASIGDYIWQQCRNLYLLYGNITPAPSELTDKYLIGGVSPDDGVTPGGYADALWYLRKWLWWMLTHQRRITIPTWYGKGVDGSGNPLLPGQIVSLTLPWVNSGAARSCRVESVRRSLRKNLSTLGLIIIDTPPALVSSALA